METLIALAASVAVSAVAWIAGWALGRRHGRQRAEHAYDRRTIEDMARAQGAERDLGPEPRNADGVRRFYRDP